MLKRVLILFFKCFTNNYTGEYHVHYVGSEIEMMQHDVVLPTVPDHDPENCICVLSGSLKEMPVLGAQ